MKFVRLTFDVDHTHAGKPVKRGEKLSVPAYNAEWLIAHHIAHRTPFTARDSAPVATEATEESNHE